MMAFTLQNILCSDQYMHIHPHTFSSSFPVANIQKQKYFIKVACQCGFSFSSYEAIFMFVDGFVMLYSIVSSQKWGSFVLLSFSCFIINLGELHRHYRYNMYFANIFPQFLAWFFLLLYCLLLEKVFNFNITIQNQCFSNPIQICLFT